MTGRVVVAALSTTASDGADFALGVGCRTGSGAGSGVRIETLGAGVGVVPSLGANVGASLGAGGGTAKVVVGAADRGITTVCVA
jgi:hypothetical protein